MYKVQNNPFSAYLLAKSFHKRNKKGKNQFSDERRLSASDSFQKGLTSLEILFRRNKLCIKEILSFLEVYLVFKMES